MKSTFRYRVKSLTGLLNRQARAVNFVWNYCNDQQKDALRFSRPWLTDFDLIYLTTGCSKELGLHSGTVNDVCQQLLRSRSQYNRPYLRYRGKKTLGWVPLKGRDLKREGDAFRFASKTFRVFYSRPLPEGKITDGNESFTTQVCSDCGALPDSRPKGIADLGVREWTCSDCGVAHHRDLNAAKNILRRGRATLAVGIPVL